MKKILIIGQALPAVKQEYPYDTTMLYDILEWVGIDKLQAQDMFEFDAISDKFPGFDLKGGHLKPSKADCDEYWNKAMENKVIEADKVILLGRASADYFNSKEKTWSCNLEVLELIHPSKRNYARIMADRNKIRQLLLDFLVK